MTTPLFSVVTINYNMGAYLERTIESVLANLVDGDEYIVIDGGSTDCSLAVLNRYRNSIKVISEPDNGYADALRKGFGMASNQLQCWVNSGDLLTPGSLAKARSHLEQGYHWVYGNDLHIDKNDKVIAFSFGKVSSVRKFMLYGGWTPLQEACFWSAEAYKEIGGIDPQFSAAADFDFFLRMSGKYKPFFINDFLGAFRKHDGQKSIKERELYHSERRKSQCEEMRKEGLSGRHIAVMQILFGIRLRIWTHLWKRLFNMKHRMKL